MNRLSPSPHYFFNRMRNDSAIGTDLIAKTQSDGWQLPYERYPFATCELGGGIEVTSPQTDYKAYGYICGVACKNSVTETILSAIICITAVRTK